MADTVIPPSNEDSGFGTRQMTLDSLEEGPIETEPEENKQCSFDEGVGVQIENVIPAAAPMPEAPKIGNEIARTAWVNIVLLFVPGFA